MVSFKKSLQFLCLFAALVVSGALIPSAVNADPIDPACDPKFMERMKERAWMEAQREIMIAQSVIAKPDSVFALGCFGEWWDVFQDEDVLAYGKGPSGAIKGFVTGFLGASFNHNFGGGHTSIDDQPKADNCGVIAQIWQHAKCANLSTGQMLTLSDLAGGAEPRQFAMSACPANTVKDLYKTPVENLVAVGLKDVKFDAMNLFIPITAPLSQTDPNNPKCSAGIPTGIQVNGKDEIVCPNPGCSPTSDGKCCKSGVPPSGQCSS